MVLGLLILKRRFESRALNTPATKIKLQKIRTIRISSSVSTHLNKFSSLQAGCENPQIPYRIPHAP
jgi:hypothetical protein